MSAAGVSTRVSQDSMAEVLPLLSAQSAAPVLKSTAVPEATKADQLFWKYLCLTFICARMVLTKSLYDLGFAHPPSVWLFDCGGQFLIFVPWLYRLCVLRRSEELDISLRGWTWVRLFVGLVTSTLQTAAPYFALKHLSAYDVALLSIIELIGTAMTSRIFRNKVLSTEKWCGMLVLSFALVIWGLSKHSEGHNQVHVLTGTAIMTLRGLLWPFAAINIEVLIQDSHVSKYLYGGLQGSVGLLLLFVMSFHLNWVEWSELQRANHSAVASGLLVGIAVVAACSNVVANILLKKSGVLAQSVVRALRPSFVYLFMVLIHYGITTQIGRSIHVERIIVDAGVMSVQIVGSLLYTEFVFAKIDSWKQGKTAHVEPVPPPL